MNTTNIVRDYPKARFPFLRFQIGRMATRPEQVVVWDSTERRRVVGYKPGPINVSVFHLLGFGSTLEKAERMVARYAR